MEKKTFEEATGVKVTDIMFEFIKVLANSCKESEFEFYKKWKDGLVKELLMQLMPEGRSNLLQDLAFDLEHELIVQSVEFNESDACIDRLNKQIEEMKSQHSKQIEEMKSQHSMLQEKYKERKREIVRIRKDNDQILNRIFSEVFINDQQYLGSDEADVEYKDIKDLQATLAEYFDKKKIIVWKLQRHVTLSSDEVEYVQSKISD